MPCINTKSDSVQFDAVARMRKYISDHIKEPITQFQLAKTSGYSQYHASRLFKEVTGQTPYEYIRKLKLSHAALNMYDEKKRVIDTAFDYVFDSHEGFTRAFAKEFGITPKVFKKHPKPLKLFMPHIITDQNKKGKGDKEMSEKPNAIFVQIVDRPKRKVILRRGKNASHYFEYCEEVGCDVWGTLCDIKGALYEPVGMWMPDNLRPEGTSVYTQGVEVPLDWEGEIPEGFEVVILPSCKILIFQGPAYDDEKFMDAIDQLWEQTKNYDPAIYGYEWDDQAAPRFQLEPMGYRGYIEGRPVKPLNR